MNTVVDTSPPWLLFGALFALALAGRWLILSGCALSGRWTRWALSALAALLIGLTCGYVLGVVGGFSRLHTGLLWLLLACAVVWHVGAERRRALLGFALVVSAGAVLLLRGSEHGPWLAGGWDPGVYANEGACAARTGTFASPSVPFYQQLGSDALRYLTTRERTHDELFPGVPVRINEGAVTLQFPRLTPVAFALVHQMGGRAAGWRTPLLLAALAALIAWALARAWFKNRGAWWTAGLALVTHPLLMYHAHTPASELLELVLVGGLLLLRCAPEGIGRTVGTAWLLTAAAANRTSFVLFGGLFVALLAVLELERPDRRRVLFEHALLVVALAVGAASHHVVTPVAVAKLHHVLPRLEWTACVVGLSALLLDVASGWPALRLRLVRWIPALVRWSVVAALGWLAWMTRHADASDLARLQALAAYFGPALLVLAGLGLLGVVLRGCSATQRLPLLWTLAVTLIVLQHPHVAELYPWATKRFLSFTLPLVAIGVGLLAQVAAGAGGLIRVMVLALIVATLALQAPRARAAWRAASYDGMPAQLADVAAQLAGADGVVADHFLWATPLALAWGLPVVNGERLWREPEAADTGAVWDRLRALRGQGREILVLTSTGAGPALWGRHAPPLRLRWSGPEVRYRETVQHRSARGFSTQGKKRQFQIYELLPESAHGG